MSLVAGVPVAGAAVALLLGTAAPAWPAVPAASPLEEARQAAEHTSFVGIMEVMWQDGAATRAEQVTVQGGGGSVLVRGANLVMARPDFERLVAHGGGGWDELWLRGAGPAPRPDLAGKYRADGYADGPAIAGRPTRVVDILEQVALRERLYLDQVTGLPLRRDQFDDQGRVVRSMAFVALSVDGATPPPDQPPRSASHAPTTVALDRLASPDLAPERLADGYQRLGVFRHGDVLQVLYSDGVYDLSVFRQPGRLRPTDLPPSGVRVPVGHATGRRYAWAGGQLVVWGGHGTVYTAVSDAPVDQVLRAAGSVPAPRAEHASLLGKLRQACRGLMEPFS